MSCSGWNGPTLQREELLNHPERPLPLLPINTSNGPNAEMLPGNLHADVRAVSAAVGVCVVCGAGCVLLCEHVQLLLSDLNSGLHTHQMGVQALPHLDVKPQPQTES